MKYVLFVYFAFCYNSLYSQTYDLHIKIEGMKSTEGNLEIGLYNNKESFPLEDKQFKVFNFSANGFSGVYTINDLPPGAYAVAIYHDKNSDKVCNTNLLGIPKESYGFSNNIKPRFSAPAFNDCKIDLNSELSITVKLIH